MQSYIVEAGSSSGASDLATLNTGTAATTLVVNNVPGGTYFVRVRARSAAGDSPTSNQIAVTVGCLPAAPTGLAATLNNSTATTTLTWNGSADACIPIQYVIIVGSSPGANDVGQFPTGTTQTSAVVPGLPNDTYYVRIITLNRGVQSPPSNEIVLVVNVPPPSRIPPGEGVTGTWVGLVANREGVSLRPSPTCGTQRLDAQLNLTQTGSTVTGTVTLFVEVSAPACGPTGVLWSLPRSGTAAVERPLHFPEPTTDQPCAFALRASASSCVAIVICVAVISFQRSAVAR